MAKFLRCVFAVAAVVSCIPGRLAAQLAPLQIPAARPGPEEIWVRAVQQEAIGRLYRLRGEAELLTSEYRIRADFIEYDEETGQARAEGHVRFEHFARGEVVEADRVEYDVEHQTGRFYGVRGQASPKLEPRPGLLTTTNPFYFQGKWAERTGDRYIVHHGTLTNCDPPSPFWTLTGKRFDIVPNDRALIYGAAFRLRGVPVLYVPLFYKSLKRLPRKSGLLTPNAGNSSRRGYMVGLGYYWAMSRSYDLMYRTQYFSRRGFAHQLDLRGKPTRNSEFTAYLYGVNDKGILRGGQKIKASGLLSTIEGQADFGHDWKGRAEINYLSSFLFRQEFTESFNEAVFSQVHSTAYLSRNWSYQGLTFHFSRDENFHSSREGDKIEIRKLPAVEFVMRDRPLRQGSLPVWVSLESSVGFLRRNQPLFQTRRFVERSEFAPRVMTALRWKEFHLLPWVSWRGTHYNSSWRDGQISGQGVVRTSQEMGLDVRLPALGRVFQPPQWLGDRLKHVIEPEVSLRHISGIDAFRQIIHFDELDLLANTTEVDLSITNRLYVKRGGMVEEMLSWQLWQRRYFNTDFGGAVEAGRRNLLLNSLELTGYAFLDGPRRYSPVVSHLQLNPRPGMGLSWRADYDPGRGRFVNSGLMADLRLGQYFVSLGHNHVRSSPVLSPNANQFRGLVGFGDQSRRGWNAAFSAIYDFRTHVMQFATVQVTYNTSCCGLSVQYRRFSFGTRNENQFRVAFAIANIGSFGTLRRQERLF